MVLLLKQMGNEFVETATPGQELMTGALGDGGIYLDAKLTQTVDDGLTLDEVVGTPVHIHIMYLLVELVGIGKDAVVGGLHVEAEDGAAEGSEPGKLVEVLENDVEGLVATP